MVHSDTTAGRPVYGSDFGGQPGFLRRGGQPLRGNSNMVEFYNTSTNVWSTATLSASGDTAATSLGNQVFFAGGTTGGGSGTPVNRNVVDIYNTSTNTWSTATLPQANSGMAATSAGGLVFFAGVFNPSGDANLVDIYNTATNTWSTATLSQGRTYLSAVTSADDQVFFAGGTNFSG